MVRIQHPNYTWCRQSADMGVVSTTLKCLQFKVCRENGVVGVGFCKSFFNIFFLLFLFLYLILHISPFGIQKNYTSYTCMPERQETKALLVMKDTPCAASQLHHLHNAAGDLLARLDLISTPQGEHDE